MRGICIDTSLTLSKTSVRLAIATLPRRTVQLCLLRAQQKYVYFLYLFYLHYDVKTKIGERLRSGAYLINPDLEVYLGYNCSGSSVYSPIHRGFRPPGLGGTRHIDLMI